MPITLWGRLNSINVQKVAWALEEAALPYRRIDAGGPFKGNDTPEYRAMNPNGLVPVIEDDGFVLWESNAIVRYVAAKATASGLEPAGLRARADADRWMDWAITTFIPTVRTPFMALVRARGSVQKDEFSRAFAEAEGLAAILDRHLEARPYVAGDTFSMGDIPLGCAAHRWLNLPAERRPTPHLERWYASLAARPATAGVLTLPIT